MSPWCQHQRPQRTQQAGTEQRRRRSMLPGRNVIQRGIESGIRRRQMRCRRARRSVLSGRLLFAKDLRRHRPRALSMRRCWRLSSSIHTGRPCIGDGDGVLAVWQASWGIFVPVCTHASSGHEMQNAVPHRTALQDAEDHRETHPSTATRARGKTQRTLGGSCLLSRAGLAWRPLGGAVEQHGLTLVLLRGRLCAARSQALALVV